MKRMHEVVCCALNNAVANDESAQPSDDSTPQDQQPPSEPTNVPLAPVNNNAGSSRLDPEQFPHQQAALAMQAPAPSHPQAAPTAQAPPAVCIVLCIPL